MAEVSISGVKPRDARQKREPSRMNGVESIDQPIEVPRSSIPKRRGAKSIVENANRHDRLEVEEGFCGLLWFRFELISNVFFRFDPAHACQNCKTVQ